MKARAFQRHFRRAKRGESQYTLEVGEANSNTAMLGQIEQAALWDGLIMGEEERRGSGNE